MKTGEYYRRNLPHIQPIGSAFFVTWTLEGAISNYESSKLKEKYERSLALCKSKFSGIELIYAKRQIRMNYLNDLEELLHNKSESPHFLLNPDVGSLVAEKIHSLDTLFYKLLGFSIMSNHVHLAIDTNFEIENPILLDKILKKIKGATAFQANKILERREKFWRRESFDIIIRDAAHLHNVMSYIANNPVKAKLCKHWKDHVPLTYLRNWD